LLLDTDNSNHYMRERLGELSQFGSVNRD